MSGDLPDDWFRPRQAASSSQRELLAQEPAQASPRHAPSTASHSVGQERRAAAPLPTTRLGGTRIVLPVLAAAVLVGAVWTVTARGAGDSAADREDPAQVAAPQPSSPTPWLGPVRTIPASEVEASCVAAEKLGYDGRTVPSDPERMLDDDPTTGWRCDGPAVGELVTFRFPPGTKLVGVRMTNGYTKSTQGRQLYAEYRRLERVTWSLPGQSSAWFVQELATDRQELQEIRIPASSADGGLRMRLEQTTEPGLAEVSRDAVVVTDVQFLVREG